jgi:uncharacterized protein YecT (DUF1311 family)
MDRRNTTEELRRHLIQSQAAWQTYVDESCAYIGGVAGRNLWIAIITVQCLMRETRSRIDALGHLPTGG